MTFLLAAVAVGASGYALLRATRLATGRLAVDVPLAWFAGSAWLGFAAFTARGLLGVPSGAVTSMGALAIPFAAWAAARRYWSGRTAGEEDRGVPASPPRRMPGPPWLFAPMAAWTVAVALAVGLHGINTPVHTDDAFRVRAFAPVLAATGAWNAQARDVIAVAGPVPTYVPALAWTLGAAVDPVHVSATIVLTFLALLALLVSLSASRGVPEVGWGAAFAITSMPLFAYHAASTYADAWLGMFLAAAFAFVIAYGRSREPADAVRALLLLLGAAMVKREGELLVLPAVAVLLAQVAWVERPRKGTLRQMVVLLGAYVLVLAARVAAVGAGGAFPFLRAAAARAVEAGPSPAASATTGPGGSSALAVFARALFTDGDLGLLWWVLAASLLLLFPRVRRAGIGWALVALTLIFAETLASAVWLYPEFTLNHGTVHRSLLPVSAVASVWLAALLTAAARRISEGAPTAPPARPGGGSRGRSRRAPRRRGG